MLGNLSKESQMLQLGTVKKDPLYNDYNLIWMDLEMTGLEPQINRIIEIAAVITDPQLNVIAEGPIIAIHQDQAILDTMDAWNTTTHTNSGLVKEFWKARLPKKWRKSS